MRLSDLFPKDLLTRYVCTLYICLVAVRSIWNAWTISCWGPRSGPCVPSCMGWGFANTQAVMGKGWHATFYYYRKARERSFNPEVDPRVLIDHVEDTQRSGRLRTKNQGLRSNTRHYRSLSAEVNEGESHMTVFTFGRTSAGLAE